jgi:hypothetical protein
MGADQGIGVAMTYYLRRPRDATQPITPAPTNRGFSSMKEFVSQAVAYYAQQQLKNCAMGLTR